MSKTLKISLSASVIGIFILLLLSNTLSPKLIKINEINEDILDKNVKINGEITNIRNYEDSDFQIITIKDETGQIDAILNQITNTTKGQKVIIIGKISKYKEKLQIQAEKILKA